MQRAHHPTSAFFTASIASATMAFDAGARMLIGRESTADLEVADVGTWTVWLLRPNQARARYGLVRLGKVWVDSAQCACRGAGARHFVWLSQYPGLCSETARSEGFRSSKFGTRWYVNAAAAPFEVPHIFTRKSRVRGISTHVPKTTGTLRCRFDYVVRPYRIAYRTNSQCATALRSCFSCAMLNPGAKSGLAASGGNIA
jgi:hypothetical protein